MSEHDDIPGDSDSRPVDGEAEEAEGSEVVAEPVVSEQDEPTDPRGELQADAGVEALEVAAELAVSEQDEPTDPGGELQADAGVEASEVVAEAAVSEQDEPTDPGGELQVDAGVEAEPAAVVLDADSPTDPESEVVTDPGRGDSDEFSTGLVAVILLFAMVVFATQGEHKDKAWVAMVGQVEAWTGLDFSEPRWGVGSEDEE